MISTLIVSITNRDMIYILLEELEDGCWPYLYCIPIPEAVGCCSSRAWNDYSENGTGMCQSQPAIQVASFVISLFQVSG